MTFYILDFNVFVLTDIIVVTDVLLFALVSSFSSSARDSNPWLSNSWNNHPVFKLYFMFKFVILCYQHLNFKFAEVNLFESPTRRILKFSSRFCIFKRFCVAILKSCTECFRDLD